ncbi:hypothetical protein CA54_59380 [Symmachiella macrocystis]|uniref:Uncharacterized protein n=1 Tax=Symmachiella macrocystis TaxID=2527985 RepID=A0A5C6AZV4_9PLAN|nr:hypothetical protein CA54_59380 [Symmachiella macrocystis]
MQRITAIIGIITVLTCPIVCHAASICCPSTQVEASVECCHDCKANSEANHEKQETPEHEDCTNSCFCKVAIFGSIFSELPPLSPSLVQLPVVSDAKSELPTSFANRGEASSLSSGGLRIMLRSLLC